MIRKGPLFWGNVIISRWRHWEGLRPGLSVSLLPVSSGSLFLLRCFLLFLPLLLFKERIDVKVFSPSPYSNSHTFVHAVVLAAVFWSWCCCFFFVLFWFAVVASVEALVLLLFAAHFRAGAGPAVVVVDVGPPAGWGWLRVFRPFMPTSFHSPSRTLMNTSAASVAAAWRGCGTAFLPDPAFDMCFKVPHDQQ